MAKVIIDIAMSLDGYVAGPNDGRGNGLGDNGGERVLSWDHSQRQLLLEAEDGKVGAMISGWRTYDITNGWNGTHDMGRGIPVFVVCEKAPESVPDGTTPFTFVTDGIASAVEQAKAAAGDKIVYVIGGANVIQQLLNEKLADELRVHIVPAFIGGGIPLFAGQDYSLTLKQTKITGEAGVAHITYDLRG